jgi:hypothetical protein
VNGPRMDDLPYESLLGLENVRKLETPTTAAALGKGFVSSSTSEAGPAESPSLLERSTLTSTASVP